jgi:hypothetical protein
LRRPLMIRSRSLLKNSRMCLYDRKREGNIICKNNITITQA